MPSIIDKIRERYRTSTPVEKAQLRGGLLVIASIVYLLLDELINGRPMKALAMFLTGLAVIAVLAIIIYICVKAAKVIGDERAGTLAGILICAFVFGGFFFTIYMVLTHWGK